MVSALDSFSEEAFNSKMLTTKAILTQNVPVSANPRAYLLGGQSGAGKTRLHKICNLKLDSNAVVINGDEYRKSHPHFNAIQERYGMDAPAHTAMWASKMTEALIDSLSAQSYNLIVEGTLRTSEVPLGTARLLHDRGYGVGLAIMAVKPEISLASCQIRYEMMRIAGTTPRATDPAHHNKIIHDIVDNLVVLEESNLFDEVVIYDRTGRQLFPIGKASQRASDVLRDTIFGSWSTEEKKHLEHLKAKLEELRATDA
ncbi:MAG: zeta toxin family protein [Eggerthellaceae bacterium]|nr:zeta toxin family protein [Eggerthellaceae bacterium]